LRWYDFDGAARTASVENVVAITGIEGRQETVSNKGLAKGVVGAQGLEPGTR
jgi:hypothetical protein